VTAPGAASARETKVELLRSTQTKFEFLPITVVASPAPVQPSPPATPAKAVTPERAQAPASPAPPAGRGQEPSPGKEDESPPKQAEAAGQAARAGPGPARPAAVAAPAWAARPQKHRGERQGVEPARDDGPKSTLAGSFLRTPGGLLLGLVGALLASLLVHLVTLSLIIRWHGRWMARQLRAEVARLPGPGRVALLGPPSTEGADSWPGEGAERGPRRLLLARYDWAEKP
jgi:hypothetical protein